MPETDSPLYEVPFVVDVPVDHIAPSPDNPRKHFDPTKLRELANDIAENGIVQPIVVLARGPQDTAYEIAFGERRWRAAQLVGLQTVPCIVRRDLQPATLDLDLKRIAENANRDDLDPIDEAEAFAKILKPIAEGGRGLTQSALAAKLNLTQSHISHRLRLLSLPERMRELVRKRLCPIEEAREYAAWTGNPNIAPAIEKQYLSAPKNRPDLNIVAALRQSAVDLSPVPAAELRDKKRGLQKRFGVRETGPDFARTPWATENLDEARALVAQFQEAKTKPAADKAAAPKAKPQPKPAAPAGAVDPEKLWQYILDWTGEQLLARSYELKPNIVNAWLLFLATSGNSEWLFHDLAGVLKIDQDDENADLKVLIRLASDKKPDATARDILDAWLDRAIKDPNAPGLHCSVLFLMAQTHKVDFARDWRPDDAFLDLLAKTPVADVAAICDERAIKLPEADRTDRDRLFEALLQDNGKPAARRLPAILREVYEQKTGNP